MFCTKLKLLIKLNKNKTGGLTCAYNFSCWKGRTFLVGNLRAAQKGPHSKKKIWGRQPKIWDYSLFFKDWVQTSQVRIREIKSSFVVSDDSKFLDLEKSIRGHWNLLISLMKVSGRSVHYLPSSSKLAGLSPWGICRVVSVIQQGHLLSLSWGAAGGFSLQYLLVEAAWCLYPVPLCPGWNPIGLLDCLTALCWEHPEKTRWACIPCNSASLASQL